MMLVSKVNYMHIHWKECKTKEQEWKNLRDVHECKRMERPKLGLFSSLWLISIRSPSLWLMILSQCHASFLPPSSNTTLLSTFVICNHTWWQQHTTKCSSLLSTWQTVMKPCLHRAFVFNEDIKKWWALKLLIYITDCTVIATCNHLDLYKKTCVIKILKWTLMFSAASVRA